MVPYDTYCKILQLQQENLRISQIAEVLNIDERTVQKWIDEKCYHQRITTQRASKLDPYKAYIIRWLEIYPYSCIQILQRIKEMGYDGGITTVRMFVAKVRPRKEKAFLTLHFEPGECAQVDWGQFGTVQVGSTQRRLSFFVMVLCHSRMMYVEFTVSETMEQFLGCHRNAFEYFGAVPGAIMVDNLKSAVLKRLVGEAPVFNPRYLNCANHYGFKIRACNVAKGNEKGRVENAVGYIKKNFLGGLNIGDFSAVNPAGRVWLDEIANVRVHGTTQKQPIELFKTEKPVMTPLPAIPYDTALIKPVRATNRFRVSFDGNNYSVPAKFACAQLTLKVYMDRICLYHENNLVAQHSRCYDRNQDFEHPDHPQELLKQRRRAREQRLHMQFLKLSHKAECYYQELTKRRMNPRHHMRQIVALSEIYGTDKVARAIEDAFTYQAFSCEYIANLLEQRARIVPLAGALHITRRQDLLDLDIAQPDLSIYDTENQPTNESENNEKQ
jgi:transposase